MKYKFVKQFAKSGNPSIVRGPVVPHHTAPHNIISWEKIDSFLKNDATLEELSNAIGYHNMRHTARTFVLYCMDMKWLKLKPQFVKV